VTLEPHTQHLVGLCCPALRDHNIYLIEPIPNTEGQRFRVPRTILSTKGNQYCQLWNSTDEPIHLPSGTLIGQIAPVEDILSIAQDNCSNMPYRPPDSSCSQQNHQQPLFRNNQRRYAADHPRGEQPFGR